MQRLGLLALALFAALMIVFAGSALAAPPANERPYRGYASIVIVDGPRTYAGEIQTVQIFENFADCVRGVRDGVLAYRESLHMPRAMFDVQVSCRYDGYFA